jgi:ubiquitin C-terminal hydrolase
MSILPVLYHHGEELSRGHYTCVVRVSLDRWILFDDDRAVPVPAPEATMPRDDRTAYILVYER